MTHNRSDEGSHALMNVGSLLFLVNLLVILLTAETGSISGQRHPFESILERS